MDDMNSHSGRALVLGGGGIAGIAWITGLLLGLREKGVDLRATSGMLIGTSAGATVAAQIAGNIPLEELFERQVDPAKQVQELAAKPQLFEALMTSLPVFFKLADPVERTLRIGDMAVNTTTVPEAARRAVIAARLPAHDWPERALKIVAVDIETGKPRIFDRLSGVSLLDAVAASCAVPGIWPAVTIDGRRYMDGGIRSMDNADLAAGSVTVIVISPNGTSGMMPGGALQQSGARTRMIEPDGPARLAIGPNPLSPETRIPAAQAGRAQGHAIAEKEGTKHFFF
jgi:NTE family protein